MFSSLKCTSCTSKATYAVIPYSAAQWSVNTTHASPSKQKKKKTPTGILLLRTRVQWHNFNVNPSISGGTSPYCWVSQVAQRKTGQSLSSSLRTSAMSHDWRMRQLCLFFRWEIELELGHLLRSQSDRKHYSKLLNLRSRLVPSWLYHMKTGVSMFIPQASTVTCYS